MRGYFVAIPTYWTYPGGQGPEEIVFDHPTPLDAPGTLRRTLESLTSLAAAGAEVGVVAAATAPALEAAVEHRVREVIESPPLSYPVRLFAASHLSILQDFCRTQGRAEWLPLLSLAGYCPDSQPYPDSRQYLQCAGAHQPGRRRGDRRPGFFDQG